MLTVPFLSTAHRFKGATVTATVPVSHPLTVLIEGNLEQIENWLDANTEPDEEACYLQPMFMFKDDVHSDGSDFCRQCFYFADTPGMMWRSVQESRDKAIEWANLPLEWEWI